MRRVLTVDGAGRIAVVRESLPSPGPGELQVEVRACCVSPGTELGSVALRRAHPTPDLPRPFGYSNAGIVIGGGPGCAAVAAGTRVACLGGGYALHASHVVVPRNLAVPIPDGVSFEAAATHHLAATGLHAVRRGEFTLGEHVVVVGLGLVGYFTAQLAALAGAHVMGVDRLPLRLRALASTGTAERVVNDTEEDPAEAGRAFSRGWGFDGGVIAFGGDATAALKTILQMLKVSPDTHRMGRIVVVGEATFQHRFAAGMGNVDIRSSARPGPGYHDPAWERGADYPPALVEWTTRRNVEECLRWMELGRLDAGSCITHRVPLEEAPAACERLIQSPDAALGVILIP